MSRAPLAFVNTATSGLLPGVHELLEVAVVKVDPETLEVIGWIHRKVKPARPFVVDPEAAAINGYTPEKWADALPLTQIIPYVLVMLEGCRWVGSNPQFHWDFIASAARECHHAMPKLADRRLVDLSSMAEPFIALGVLKSAGLDNLMQHFGMARRQIPQEALRDARLALDVYRHMVRCWAQLRLHYNACSFHHAVGRTDNGL